MSDPAGARVLVVPFRVGQPMPAPRLDVECEELRPPLPDGTAQERLGVLCGAIAARVAAGAARAVYIGDCVLTLGVLAGLQRRGLEPNLIWLDAHADFNTWETTPSGFLGGMPLAMAVGLGEQTIVRAAGLRPISAGRIVLADGRDLDPGEDLAVAGSGVHRVDVERLLAVPLPPGPLYVHLDVDVVDPAEMPAVSYRAPGGPSSAAVRGAVTRLASTGQIAAFSVTLWEPELPGAERSGAAAAALTRPLLDAVGVPRASPPPARPAAP